VWAVGQSGKLRKSVGFGSEPFRKEGGEIKEKFPIFIRKHYLWFDLLNFLKSNKWEQFPK
jgi:hypothetical protein